RHIGLYNLKLVHVTMSSSTTVNHITIPRVERPIGACSMKQHIFSVAQFVAIVVRFDLIAFVPLASFVIGLPFGPLGVAIAFSAIGLLGRLPILYYIAGRRGPVTTSDLWTRFFRQLPLWVVMFVTTWLIRSAVADLHPLTQSLICAPIGVLAG